MECKLRKTAIPPALIVATVLVVVTLAYALAVVIP